METVNLPRLLLAAPASGSGKTTVSCAILRALVKRGMRVASFKSGPDYIDPMFHRSAVGAAYSSNLDLYLGDRETICRLLADAGRTDLALIEGAMGLYDGLAGKSIEASAYDLGRGTKTPTILVINGRGMAVSIAAMVNGFKNFRSDSGIVGVILNQLSPSVYPEVQELIERECAVDVFGYLPPMPGCGFESRHLGLVTAREISRLREKLDRLAEQAEQTIDLDGLVAAAQNASTLIYQPLALEPVNGTPRIAVAHDAAFSFYYADSLALLQLLGAELVWFSPLADRSIPFDCDGLLLGGGYPELHAWRLARNRSMQESVRKAIESGMPTIAECGGFLYLHRTLEDRRRIPHRMVGLIPAAGYKTDQLSRFGYVELTAKQDNLLCSRGGTFRAHEFHYWESGDCGDGFSAQKPMRDVHWDCVHITERLYAGFPHLYLAGDPPAARRFLNAALEYRKEQGR